MADEKSSRMDRRGFFRLGVTTAVAIGATSLLAACAPAQPEKPPVTAPSTDPGEPSPSEGNPPSTPENPGDNETDPLSPESLWAMSEKELLEAVRIPEGTSPEEWAQLYAKYKQALLNAIADQDAYEKWDKETGAPDNTSANYAKYVFNKFVGPLEQLEGSTISRNGPTMLVYQRAALMLYSRSTKTWAGQPPAGAIAPHITVEVGSVSSSNGGVTFEQVLHDNITDEYLEWFENNIGMDKNKFRSTDGVLVMSQEPTVRTVKKLGYNKAKKTMQPSGWGASRVKTS